VDVRIISATNRDLQEKVKDGSFREDLYYRLNVIPIQLPPLRKRPEDIPILTTHFIEKYSREFSKEVKTISTYALELLMNYPFPGNIRELENIMERSVALETSSIILPENLILSGSMERYLMDDEEPMPEGGIQLNEELAKFEKRLIEKALKKVNGSRSKAAELLHVTIDSLKYRLEKLVIE
jgi:two-component system response regulator PilR (NtrC family)